jgi:RimJ/RimL family protein N-acetyltransferase
MFALWREPAVCEYSGQAIDAKGRLLELPAASPATSDRLLEFCLDRAQMRTGFRWAAMLEEGSTFIGAVGFNSLGACVEYAYHFDPRYWGAGLAAEASLVALSWRSASASGS